MRWTNEVIVIDEVYVSTNIFWGIDPIDASVNTQKKT